MTSLGRPRRNWEVILKLFLNKSDVEVWTQFCCLRIVSDGRQFWTRWWACESHKRWGTFWPLKPLSASHEGLISMELVHWEVLSSIKTRFLFRNYPIRIWDISCLLPRQYLPTRHDCPLPSFHLFSIHITFRVHSMLYIKLMQLKNQPVARPYLLSRRSLSADSNLSLHLTSNCEGLEIGQTKFC
jgi:hypothetical protein